jgi:hypothetical protein
MLEHIYLVVMHIGDVTVLFVLCHVNVYSSMAESFSLYLEILQSYLSPNIREF